MDDEERLLEAFVVNAEGEDRASCIGFADEMAAAFFTEEQRSTVRRQIQDAGIEEIIQSTAGQNLRWKYWAKVVYLYDPTEEEVTPWPTISPAS